MPTGFVPSFDAAFGGTIGIAVIWIGSVALWFVVKMSTVMSSTFTALLMASR